MNIVISMFEEKQIDFDRLKSKWQKSVRSIIGHQKIENQKIENQKIDFLSLKSMIHGLELGKLGKSINFNHEM